MFIRKALVLSTLFLSAFSYHNTPTPREDRLTDWDALQNLLDSIDSTVLHGVLHQLSPKFKDGVFSKDRSALEHVHSENPAVATKLVHIALKRQAANATTTRVSPAQQSSKEASQTSEEASVSQALNSQIHASTVPAKTTVHVAPSQPPDTTPISTGDGFVVYSTIGGGVVTKTSQAVPVSFTPSTSTHLYYTTLPNGQVQTSTSVVVVNAPMTGEPTAAGAAATSAPGLQNVGAFVQVGSTLLAAVCGLAAFML